MLPDEFVSVCCKAFQYINHVLIRSLVRYCYCLGFFLLNVLATCQQNTVQHQQLQSGRIPGEVLILDSMHFNWCPPGTFMMGSPSSERGHRSDEQQVEVILTQGFWMGTFEVTQKQWLAIMDHFPDNLPQEKWGEGPAFPVYWVNYPEALQFCNEMTDRWQKSGMIPHDWMVWLPTEAQWEYACRAGNQKATAFGDTLQLSEANFNPLNTVDHIPLKATPVGSYSPNAWGIYDMHGNEFEWCLDWYHGRLPGGIDPDLSQIRGVPNRDGSYSRVRRGGAWNDEYIYCRSAFRLRYEPERRADHIGFRVVLKQAKPTGN